MSDDIVQFVLEHLSPGDRELWDEYCAPYLETDGLAVSLWGFTQICMLVGEGMPDWVLTEAFRRLAVNPRDITEYHERMKAKVRRERGES